MNVLHLLVAFGLLAQLGGGGQLGYDDGTSPSIYPDENGDLVLTRCDVTVQEDVRIPAQEAGVLIRLPVKEGSRVEKGQLLAIIDNRESKAALDIATIALESARKRADEDIEVRYATAAAKVAKVDYEQDLRANRINPTAIPEIEIRRKELEWKSALLRIEKSENDRVLAGYEVKVKEAELEAAKKAVERRSVVAPFDGEVVRTFLHEAEWVNPGDSILRLMKLDVLYVQEYLDANLYDRSEIIDRPVTVEITLARDRTVNLSGRVVYVSQLVQSDGRYLIRAEVKNQRENDQWLISPGLKTRMKILLGSSQ